MEIPLPSTNANSFTIYSISSCPYCTKVKELLEKENPIIINCDEYRKNDRETFLKIMDGLTGLEYRTFPMVFHGTKFIGGYDNSVIYYKQIIKEMIEITEVDDF